jgi:hypothetical protein
MGVYITTDHKGGVKYVKRRKVARKTMKTSRCK